MTLRELLAAAAAVVMLNACCGNSNDSFETLNSQAVKEYAFPVRPGYEGKSAYWNAFSPKFIYAPAFDIKEVEGAVKYRFTVTSEGEGGESCSFEAEKPCAPLSPVWNDIPAGNVKLVVESVAEDGTAAPIFERKFLRDFPFCGPYPVADKSYSEAAVKALLYVHEMPQVQRWLESGEPDMSYVLYSYPAKMLSAVICNETALAGMMPEYRESCEKIALAVADFLISLSKKEGEPLAFFPPTYYGDLIASGNAENAGKMMTLDAESAAEAFLDLYLLTEDEQFLERAKGIVRTYSGLMGEDGSLPIKLYWETGESVGSGKAMPDDLISLCRRLHEEFGIDEFDEMAARCASWISAVPLKSFDLTGQFEDTSVDVVTHQNLTHWSAVPYALYLLAKENITEDEYQDAMDLIRFSEDQFVYWDALPNSNGNKGIWAPCAYEQYMNSAVEFPDSKEQFNYLSPIDCSAANIMLAMARAYQVSGDELMYAKAKALADNLVLSQKDSGKIPTVQSDYTDDFWINCQNYTVSALLEMEKIVAAHK
ncbi:MAG: hypothetical protein HUJ91_02195 [Bacteroidales bacterium]|nr:hypothetical protein [Bacteroidales bacterium]